MKTTILKFAALLLIVLGSFASCEEKEEKDTEPVEIPFTEYSLTGTSCHWTNLAYDNKVIIINNTDGLEKYIGCEEGGYPEIDFSKQTLLLASGGVTSGIERLSKKLLMQNDEYVLEVEITLNMATVAEKWVTAILVEKINAKASVELNVTIIRN